MHYSITKVLLAIAFTALAGCGQTGPLFLPDGDPPPPPPVEQAEAAAQQSTTP